MLPRAPLIGSSFLPTAAAFWMPGPDDIDEEGFGYFRDTWLIRDVQVRDARCVAAEERRIASAIDGIADNAEHFERLASAVEHGSVDDPDNGLTAAERSVLGQFASDVPAELGGLELGVAGLVYALATVRILPAASCRSHDGLRSWSDAPVVLFATTEFRARALQPLVQASGCTFFIDDARPELLAVRGQSIANTMTLADAVLASRATFVRPRRPRRSASRADVSGWQDTLF